jgi:hypothetical protein
MTATLGEFDPDRTNSTGKDKIVSLILPKTATRIIASDNGNNSTFKSFSNLTSIRGENITAVGDYAFSKCGALTTMNLPETRSIGLWAFQDCALVSVNLPKVTSIADYAFRYCYRLVDLFLPANPPELGSYVFFDTNRGVGAGTTLTIHVASPGTVDAYTAAWSVSAITTAAGNTSIYGNTHKRIVITTAP